MKGGSFEGTAKAAVLGGTFSKLVGGKFANGAVSAAFVHLFNDLAKERITVRKSVDIKGHYYRIRGLVCSESTSGCNIELGDKIYNEYVNKNDVPLSFSDSGSGRKWIFGIQPIDHYEFPQIRTSINYTLAPHFFTGGSVVHQIHFENGNMYYDVTGIGSGSTNGLINNYFAEPSFRSGVENVINTFGR